MNHAIPTVSEHRSPVARAALLAYVLLIVYASWFPFSGWHNNGMSPFAYAQQWRMPRYWTLFDAIINVVGYIPLGILIIYALYPRIKRIGAVLIAIVSGVVLSGTMEAVQTFLPSRVASSLDLWTNVAGCSIGAVLGAFSVQRILDQSQLYRLRQRWFVPHASQGLVLLALWPLAQIYPQAYLFAHGQLLPILSGWLSSMLGNDIDLASYLRTAAPLTAEQYWLAETIITACGMTGAALTMLCVLRRDAPKAALVIALICAAILTKVLASALLFAPENAVVWITPGAQGGFLIGAIMLGGLTFAPPAAQRRLAQWCLILSLLIVNITPVNPYFMATLQAWIQGKFLNFNGAAQFLSLLWPFFALCFLSLPAHHHGRQQGDA